MYTDAKEESAFDKMGGEIREGRVCMGKVSAVIRIHQLGKVFHGGAPSIIDVLSHHLCDVFIMSCEERRGRLSVLEKVFLTLRGFRSVCVGDDAMFVKDVFLNLNCWWHFSFASFRLLRDEDLTIP